MSEKAIFETQLKQFVNGLDKHISTPDGQWTVKGFIDVLKNVYSISSDTKIVSKILEIHLFPRIIEFADKHGYRVVLPEHQNYYPDISFLSVQDESVRFAVDFKTTYRKSESPHLCNGFTLGSHGKYFEDRTSVKNIQYPYSSYAGHFCLGIIYDRLIDSAVDKTGTHHIDQPQAITSVIGSFQFFVAEKWKIASDKRGSGNTANIGSINNIQDIINGDGMFSRLGESWFDDYWMNYGKIAVAGERGKTSRITKLADFVRYRNGDPSLIVPKRNRSARTTA
ncbi:MAG: restriction endonuclease [Gammaproteobacteria bacterium]|nr:restriction endonuclease [Gammaproteobacteria bacterium]MCY4283617.1 restriction endonuclease [Gammaproteobacteria bacterium]